MAGRYASDGSLRISIVDGSTRTGLFAPDGSIYVVESDGSSFVGHSHPCGALNVTPVSAGNTKGVYAPDGSMNVYVGSGTYNNGAYGVTIVSGSFGGGGPTLSKAQTLAEVLSLTDVVALDFTDSHFYSTTNYRGSMYVKDTLTPANNYNNSPRSTATASKVVSGASGLAILRQADGHLDFATHNLALRSDDVSHASWTKTGATTPTANTISFLTPGNGNRISQTFSSGLLWDRTLIFSAVLSGSGTVTLAISDDGVFTRQQVTLTGTPTRYSVHADIGITGSCIAYVETNTGDTASSVTITDILAEASYHRTTPGRYIQTTSAIHHGLPYEWDAGGNLLGLWYQDARTNIAWHSNDQRITTQIAVSGGSGTFTDGETVTATGGGTGTYRKSASSTTIFAVSGGSGTFSGTLTGGTSGATRTIGTVTSIWAATNATIARTATGPNNRANYACTLTATAANATVLQSVTAASAGRVFGCWVKRRTGTGNIDLTVNNGTTWTTVAVTSSWTKVSCPSVTAANPVFGWRIATSGDEIDVCFAQCETSTFTYLGIPAPAVNSNGSYAAAPFNHILTSVLPTFGSAATLYAKALYPTTLEVSARNTAGLGDTATNQLFVGARANLDDFDCRVLSGGVSVAALSGGSIDTVNGSQMALAVALNDAELVVDGVSLGTDTSCAAPTVYSRLQLGVGTAGTSSSATGWLQQVLATNVRVSQADMITLTTS